MAIQPILRLDRFADGDWGTVGKFTVLFSNHEDTWRCYSLEEEDQRNQRNISRIPAGVYRARRHQSPTFGETFIVEDVKNRTFILFHPGNTEEDTDGCILLGEELAAFIVEDEDGGGRVPKIGVASSRSAFQMFMSKMEGHDEATLVVTDLFT